MVGNGNWKKFLHELVEVPLIKFEQDASSEKKRKNPDDKVERG